jgi:hypothetical protein
VGEEEECAGILNSKDEEEVISICCPLAVHIAPTVPIRERRLPYCDWGGQRELRTWEAGTPVCFRYDKIVCWR